MFSAQKGPFHMELKRLGYNSNPPSSQTAVRPSEAPRRFHRGLCSSGSVVTGGLDAGVCPGFMLSCCPRRSTRRSRRLADADAPTTRSVLWSLSSSPGGVSPGNGPAGPAVRVTAGGAGASHSPEDGRSGCGGHAPVSPSPRTCGNSVSSARGTHGLMAVLSGGRTLPVWLGCNQGAAQRGAPDRDL